MLSTEWLESSLFEVVSLLQWSVQVWAVHKHCHCWMWCCYPVWGMMVLILPGWTGTAASAGKPDTWGIRQCQDRQKWQLVTICESVLLARVAQFAKFALTSRLLDWLRHREKCAMSQWSISFWFDLDQCTFTRQKRFQWLDLWPQFCATNYSCPWLCLHQIWSSYVFTISSKS